VPEDVEEGEARRLEWVAFLPLHPA